MARGSCTCGQFTYEVPENPDSVILCHCIPCRKFAGVNGSTNCLVAEDKYKVLTGTSRTFERSGDSGKNVTNHYCSNCSTLMYVDAEAMPGMIIYKPGTLDDAPLNEAKPVAEVYTRNRPNCFEALKDASQAHGAA